MHFLDDVVDVLAAFEWFELELGRVNRVRVIVHNSRLILSANQLSIQTL
jgi:hypothetical protein